jgi:hypothetical protein
MAAWESMDDAAYDRAESYGQAATYYGHPEPCDDAFWLGVNARADAMARTTDAALAAVDSVIGLLPSVEGDPCVELSPGVDGPVPSSPSAPLRDAA